MDKYEFPVTNATVKQDAIVESTIPAVVLTLFNNSSKLHLTYQKH